MATPLDINRQYQLEKEAISCGRMRLHESLKTLEMKSYSSASVYGTASITSALPGVIEHIAQTRAKIQEGVSGQYYKAFAEHLDDLEDLAIAAIALKITFDNVFSLQRDKDSLTNISYSIGTALEQECKLRWYRMYHPGLMHHIEETYYHAASGTQQKVKSATNIFNKCDIVWPKWGRDKRVQLGSWGYEAVQEATGWFEIVNRNTSRKRLKVVADTESFRQIREALLKKAELFS